MVRAAGTAAGAIAAGGGSGVQGRRAASMTAMVVVADSKASARTPSSSSFQPFGVLLPVGLGEDAGLVVLPRRTAWVSRLSPWCCHTTCGSASCPQGRWAYSGWSCAGWPSPSCRRWRSWRHRGRPWFLQTKLEKSEFLFSHSFHFQRISMWTRRHEEFRKQTDVYFVFIHSYTDSCLYNFKPRERIREKRLQP